jgi:proteasome lid subunit RPN8/RPN11
MSFSIKATIRAFVAPEHRVSCPRKLWEQVLAQLEQRGERVHESGAFLLGVRRKRRCEVRDFIFYDELDAGAYSSGICILTGSAFASLWARCRKTGLTVVADMHTHPGSAGQSDTDRRNPMIARSGHIAIIVPRYAVPPVDTRVLGIYEYRGDHEWTHHNEGNRGRFLYVGRWS